MSVRLGFFGLSSSCAIGRVCRLSSRIGLYSRDAEVANLVVFAHHASPFIRLQRISSQCMIITMSLRPRSNNEAIKKRRTRLREAESEIESGSLERQPFLTHVIALGGMNSRYPQGQGGGGRTEVSLSPIDPVVPPRCGHWLLPKGLEDVTAGL